MYAPPGVKANRNEVSVPDKQRAWVLGELAVAHHPGLRPVIEHVSQGPSAEVVALSRAGARRYPGDFKAGRSPTVNPMAEVVLEGMRVGDFRKDDHWEITFEMGALSHGLIMLYLGGRLSTSVADFRALYRRSFRRYIHGIRN